MNFDNGGEREMHTTTCADCGSEAKVPFEPRGDRPVYCRDCFSKNKPARGGGGGGPKQMYDAVCAECNNETQVPFEPRGDRPVYCRDCFQKQRG